MHVAQILFPLWVHCVCVSSTTHDTLQKPWGHSRSKKNYSPPNVSDLNSSFYFPNVAILKKGRILKEEESNNENEEKENVLGDFMAFLDVYKKSNSFSQWTDTDTPKKIKRKTNSLKEPKTNPLESFREHSFTETNPKRFDYRVKENKTITDKNGKVRMIVKNFEHYRFYATSEKIINDISVDASDISQNAINYLGIAYSPENSDVFSHNRTIVVTNKGEKSYRIAFITKYPNFVKYTTKKTDPSILKNSFVEETASEYVEDPYEQYNVRDHTNLYAGNGSAEYIDDMKEKNVDELSGNETSTENIRSTSKHSVFRKITNFLNLKKVPSVSNVDSLEAVSNGGEEKTAYERKKGDMNYDSHEGEQVMDTTQLPKTIRRTSEHKVEKPLTSIDKLLDQYLLNTTVSGMKVQELIISFKGELNFNSGEIKSSISKTIKKIEEKMKKNFLPVQSIDVEVTSPINFICVFVPVVFDMHNLYLLKEVLEMIQSDFQNFMESWSFSHIYKMNSENTGMGEEKVDNKEKQQSLDRKSSRKKYVRKNKSLYERKMSFVNRSQFIKNSFATIEPKVQYVQMIEHKLLNMLPKELSSYSVWNLTQTRVPNAWLLGGYGNENIKVCIVDSGIDMEHSDLVKNIVVPPFFEDYEVTEELYNSMVKSPTDLVGHGTHIAGIIGGSANGLGIVGVAPNVKMVSLRFVQGKNIGGSYYAVRAINICVINKCPIINASWGSHRYDVSLQRILDKLKGTFRGKGTAFITVAGNDNTDIDDIPVYPASYKLSHMLSVASISENLKISAFSNYGKNTVHLYAPGHSIYSSVPKNTYKNSTGTSMAAPHVTGVSALVYSVCFEQGYIPNAVEVLDIIIRTSIKIDSSAQKTIHESLVNAEGAVLTTLLGGLWMQIDCKYSQFTLRPEKKKHVPIYFSAYKKGIYQVYLVIAIFPLDDKENYGEIVVPVKIFTDDTTPNFQQSPKNGNAKSIDESEELNDHILDYICENSLFNLEAARSALILIIIKVAVSFLIISIIIIGIVLYIFKRKGYTIRKGGAKEKADDEEKEAIMESLKTYTKRITNLFSSASTKKDESEVSDKKQIPEEAKVESLLSVNETEKEEIVSKLEDSVDLIDLQKDANEIKQKPVEQKTGEQKTEEQNSVEQKSAETVLTDTKINIVTEKSDRSE